MLSESANVDIRGVGVLGVPPPLLLGNPKLHKEGGGETLRVRSKTQRFST